MKTIVAISIAFTCMVFILSVASAYQIGHSHGYKQGEQHERKILRDSIGHMRAWEMRLRHEGMKIPSGRPYVVSWGTDSAMMYVEISGYDTVVVRKTN